MTDPAAATIAYQPSFDWFESHPDGAVTAYSNIPLAPGVMRRLSDELFINNWSRIVVGPCIEGAVFEVRFVEAPAVRYSDGYLTVDLGPWHFHLCIEEHKGSSSQELRRNRTVAKAALYERRGKGCAGGRTWGIRLWNGYGEQMTTVFLPNPQLTDDMQFIKMPDWNRLELYYKLRATYLGEPMPTDLQLAAELPLPELPFA